MSDERTLEEQCYGECWAAKERIAELEAQLTVVKADLATRTAERDKTRKLYCIEMSRQSLDPKRYTPERCAKERGWDCFDAKEGR